MTQYRVICLEGIAAPLFIGEGSRCDAPAAVQGPAIPLNRPAQRGLERASRRISEDWLEKMPIFDSAERPPQGVGKLAMTNSLFRIPRQKISSPPHNFPADPPSCEPRSDRSTPSPKISRGPPFTAWWPAPPLKNSGGPHPKTGSGILSPAWMVSGKYRGIPLKTIQDTPPWKFLRGPLLKNF